MRKRIPLLTIRVYNNKDKLFVHNLLKENMASFFIKHFGSWDEYKFEEKWKSKRFMIVEKGGIRTGFYDVEIKEDSAHIHEIQIKKGEQGKGLGSDILKYIEKSLPKKIKTITLHVFKDNVNAFNFYKKLGYYISREAHSGSSYLMKKELES